MRIPQIAAAPARVLLGSALLGLAGFTGLLVPAGASAAPAADPAATPPGQSWVRVGHFVPGMGATSIELEPADGGEPQTIAEQATYGQVSTYDKVPPGTYTAVVRSTDDPAGGDPILSRSLDLTAGQARTLAVLGSADAPRLAVLEDDLTPPSPGDARVRLLLAAEDEDAVTVKAIDGPTIATDAVLGQATSYASVPAGTWSLELTGTTSPAAVQDVPIAAGSVYTVVALAGPSQGVELSVVTDAAGAAVTPRGGAKTGLGGMTALGDTSSGPGSGPTLAAVAGGLLLGAGLVAGARRGRRLRRVTR